MRKALCLALCSISCFNNPLRTESNTPSNNEPTKRVYKDLKPLYGYDVYHKHIKKFSVSDQCKLKPKLKKRAEHLAVLKNTPEFDVLVIGGGCTGAGTLLEASSRGLSCALIDRGDFGIETSSRSTKLFHGRVKHLKDIIRFEREVIKRFKLLLEGLDERNFIINSAAYMNKEIEIVIPSTNVFKWIYHYIGVSIYHLLSYFQWIFSDYGYKLPRPSLITQEQMQKLVPSLKYKSYGVKLSESQISDTRLLIQSLLTATQNDYLTNMKGATLANYVEFVDFIKDNNGKCVGVNLIDRTDGSKFSVKARAIINCTGGFADEIRRKDNPNAIKRTIGSRGVHLAIEQKYTKKRLGVLIPNTSDGRMMFVLPYERMTIAGTTDHRCEVQSTPIAPLEDIKEIEKELSKHFTSQTPFLCTAAWCGIRPLVLDTNKELSRFNPRRLLGRKDQETKVLPRSHVVEVSKSGLISVMGGRWTVYRKMGQTAIDTALKAHPEIIPSNKVSVTRNMRLIGGYTSKSFDGSEDNVNEFIGYYKRILHEKYSLDWELASNLVETYGIHSIKVANIGVKKGMNGRLHKDYHYTKAQVIYAIRKELATNVRDVVFRRLGIGFFDKIATEKIIPIVATIMAKEMDWSKEKKAEEIKAAKDSLLTLA